MFVRFLQVPLFGLVCSLSIGLLGAGEAAAQVTNYRLFKEAYYSQTGADTVSLDFWAGVANVQAGSEDATNIRLTPPAPAAAFDDAIVDGAWEFFSEFPTQAALDAAFPDGTYRYEISGGVLGTQLAELTMPAGFLPDEVPQFDAATYSALTTSDGSSPVSLAWNDFSPHPLAANARVRLFLHDLTSNDFMTLGSNLAPNTSSYGLVAGTLTAGHAYDLILIFSNAIRTANAGFGSANSLVDANRSVNLRFTVVPEPGTALLMGLGLGGLAAAGRRSPAASRFDSQGVGRASKSSAGSAISDRQRSNSMRLFVSALFFCIATASTASAASYTITPLPIPAATYVAGEDVSESGLVAGGYFDSSDAAGGFVFDGIQSTHLALPGGGGIYGNGINAAGVVAGYAVDASGQRQGVVWSPAAGGILLGTLGGDRSTARGINGVGVVVGDSRNAFGATRPFSWTEAGGMVELPISLGGTSASAVAISDDGRIAGRARNSAGEDHAVLFDSSTSVTLDLGTLGGPNSFANGISPNGFVAGLSDAPNDEFRPFFWSEATGMVDVFAAGTLGAPYGAAYDVNSAGQVVGYGEINDDFDARAFVWTQAGGLTDLNTLIPEGSGWVLLGASGINDAGQIVGWGTLNGEAAGFQLTVVPEPGTALLTALGLGGLAATRKRSGAKAGASALLAAVGLVLGVEPAAARGGPDRIQAIDDWAVTTRNVAVSIDVTKNDLGRSPRVSKTTRARCGRVEIEGDSVVRYTPDVDGECRDVFWYWITNGGRGAAARVDVRVLPDLGTVAGGVLYRSLPSKGVLGIDLDRALRANIRETLWDLSSL